MNSQNTSTPDTSGADEPDALDRAAAQGKLPEGNEDDAPDGGQEERVQDSTEQAADASILGFRLRP